MESGESCEVKSSCGVIWIQNQRWKREAWRKSNPALWGLISPGLANQTGRNDAAMFYQKKSSLKGLWELRKLKINKVRTSSDEGQQTSTSGLSAAVQLDGIQRSLRCGEATGFGKAFPVKWQINGGEVDLHTARVTKSRTKPGELRQDYIWLWQSS